MRAAPGVFIFGLGVVLIFLVLAAMYESWGLPLSIILVVPMCLLSSIAGLVWIAHKPIDIFSQIGFVVLVAMAAKNAILIVAFARDKRKEGMGRREATLESCKLRLRPILMTSFAFILGVYPLVVATGAGWEMQRSLGTAVFSGMIGVTLFGIFLTPVFYCVIFALAGGRRDPIKSLPEPQKVQNAGPLLPRLREVKRRSGFGARAKRHCFARADAEVVRWSHRLYHSSADLARARSFDRVWDSSCCCRRHWRV